MIRTPLLLVLASLGCTVAPRPAPPPPPAPNAAPPRAAHDIGAPVLVSWIVREEPATASRQGGAPGHYLLSARVAQPGYLGLPLQVSVELPPGVSLVRGPARWIVQPAAPGTVNETVLEVLAPVAPADDLVLVADAQGEHAGVHAEARYRFGRPEPRPPSPPLTPSDIVIHGHNLGRAVQMSP